MTILSDQFPSWWDLIWKLETYLEFFLFSFPLFSFVFLKTPPPAPKNSLHILLDNECFIMYSLLYKNMLLPSRTPSVAYLITPCWGGISATWAKKWKEEVTWCKREGTPPFIVYTRFEEEPSAINPRKIEFVRSNLRCNLSMNAWHEEANNDTNKTSTYFVTNLAQADSSSIYQTFHL